MAEGILAGVPSYWRSFGHGSCKALALHCSLAHSGAWAGLAAGLPDVTMVAPDLLGHGRSGDWAGGTDSGISDVGVPDFHGLATRQAMALMEDAPVHLIGHSFGATVALRIALELPERVASLTLFEPVLFAAARAAGGPAFANHIAAHQPFEAAWLRGDREGAAKAFQAIWGRGEVFAELPQSQRRYIAERIGLIVAQNAVLLEDAAGLLAYGRLEGLGVPVLLVEGAKSPPVIDAINTELARRLPQVTRAVVANAAHMLPITHPGKCAALVAPFIAAAASV